MTVTSQVDHFEATIGGSVCPAIDTRRPEQGAETSIYLASSPEVEGVTGKYFSDKREIKSSAASYDVNAARRLWELSEQMVHEKVAA
jgi:hypothetical protein